MTHDAVLQPISAMAVRAGRRVGQSPGRLPDPAVHTSTNFRWRKPVLRWGQDAQFPRERRPPQPPHTDDPDFRITRARNIYGILGWRTSCGRGSFGPCIGCIQVPDKRIGVARPDRSDCPMRRAPPPRRTERAAAAGPRRNDAITPADERR